MPASIRWWKMRRGNGCHADPLPLAERTARSAPGEGRPREPALTPLAPAGASALSPPGEVKLSPHPPAPRLAARRRGRAGGALGPDAHSSRRRSGRRRHDPDRHAGARRCRGGRLLSGEVGDLFDRMLAAIGRSRETIWLAPFASIRSIGGRLPDAERSGWPRIARHHIGLVRPKRLLIMGEAQPRR